MADIDLGKMVDHYWQEPQELAGHLGEMAENIMYGRNAYTTIDHMAVLSALVTARDWKPRWHGLDLKHIPAPVRLWVLSRLTFDGARPYLNQEVFNFLALADHPEPVLGLRSLQFAIDGNKKGEIDGRLPLFEILNNTRELRARILSAYSLSLTEAKLAMAFRNQLVQEARPYEKKVFTGALIMDRIPFEHLDRHMEYDTLRLVIVPTGIFCSPIKDNCYMPFFWTAAGDTHMPFLSSAQIDMSLDVLMAGIWRDACVVQKKFIEERVNKDPRPRSGKKSGVVVLPRQIREVAWADERERTGITHAMHKVRGHYRELPEGWHTSDTARALAEAKFFPPPPEGFTFVSPHTRGHGDEAERVDVRKVVCQGLRTVAIALG